jgi:hypothetical protein
MQSFILGWWRCKTHLFCGEFWGTGKSSSQYEWIAVPSPILPLKITGGQHPLWPRLLRCYITTQASSTPLSKDENQIIDTPTCSTQLETELWSFGEKYQKESVFTEVYCLAGFSLISIVPMLTTGTTGVQPLDQCKSLGLLKPHICCWKSPYSAYIPVVLFHLDVSKTS